MQRCLAAAGVQSLYEPSPGHASNGPDLLINSSRFVYLVLLIAYASSIWNSITRRWFWNRWFSRQRPHAHAPEVASAPCRSARSWARFSESLVSCCTPIARHLEGSAASVSHQQIHSSVARFNPVHTSEVAQAAL
jgi:hypothetical protein